ncbi:RnfABCDGE type electron transport complex subunit B [Pseudomonas guariconensis]|nr:RnfABCDGE type electron transport complex subunit B [Pseudomonas guariconensis]MBF8750967.1 RnfABCDGE type electron transport complex subunit B [Pseudomonas guariconensis]
MSLIQRIDALLPQTQCGKCGHAGCRPYAQGLAAGEAINKCPPGGAETIAALARLLETPIIDLDPSRGSAPPQVAYIREAECIGCTKCIQACPVDAIVGAAKLMHTVIASECTGCDLCLAPCPVDCIDLLPLPDTLIPIVGGLAQTPLQQAARTQRRDHARRRHEQRNARLQRDEARRQAERLARNQRPVGPTAGNSDAAPDPIKAAIERVKAQKAASSDAALKQAKIAAAMSRAQLSKARSAFGNAPSEAQLEQLRHLEEAAEQAQRRLDALLAEPGHASA